MDCCDNKNITCKNYENVCINCGTTLDYQYINEISFKDYNMNMLNILFYKKTIYMRKKYLNKKTIYMRKNIYIKNVYILKNLTTTLYYFLIIH